MLWFALCSCTCMLVCFPGGVCALVCSVFLYMYVGLFSRGSVCFGLLCAPVHVCLFVSQGECVFGLLCVPVRVCWFVSQGECVLTPAFYAHLVHMLKPLAGGRMCVVLEVRSTQTSMLDIGTGPMTRRRF